MSQAAYRYVRSLMILVIALLSLRCATLSRIAAEVAMPAQEMAQIISALEAASAAFFDVSPNEEIESLANDAFKRARLSLAAVSSAADTAGDLGDGAYQDALLSLQQAWSDLLALLGPLGIIATDHLGAATPPQLPDGAPDPIALPNPRIFQLIRSQ